jgi:outer membrane protein assembly factor BamA
MFTSKLYKIIIPILVASFFANPLQAKQINNCQLWQPLFSNLDDLVIGEINTLPLNIFDLSSAKETTRIHHLINKLHIKTKVGTIEKQLLFKTGDAFKPDILKETERYLRAKNYIKDALIEPTELCGKQVIIKVMTRDNWTLTPDISFGRSGGNNKIGFKIQEQNILGNGKDLQLGYSKRSERQSTKLSYRDYHLLGSHHKLTLNLLKNSDGEGYQLDLGLPFYKSSSRYSWGAKSSHLSQITPIYVNAKINQKVNETKQLHALHFGWTNKHNAHFTQRFKVGWSLKKNEYEDSAKTLAINDLTESYPWFEVNRFGTHYVKKLNFNTMGKIEDVSLAQNITLGAGLLLQKFGSTDNMLKLTSSYSKGFQISQSLLGFLKLSSDNYLGKGVKKGGSYKLQAELNHFKSTGNDIRLKSIFRLSDHLLPTEQIYLGGDSGMRGFPKAFQSGNKSFLLQAEKRLHFEWYPLHLAKFGAVAFSDIGSAWGDDKNPKLLANIGLGLRMIPTRSSSSKTMHLNLAMPLTQRNIVDKFQISISTAKSF